MNSQFLILFFNSCDFKHDNLMPWHAAISNLKTMYTCFILEFSLIYTFLICVSILFPAHIERFLNRNLIIRISLNLHNYLISSCLKYVSSFISKMGEKPRLSNVAFSCQGTCLLHIHD
jgi:hypothetical protein